MSKSWSKRRLLLIVGCFLCFGSSYGQTTSEKLASIIETVENHEGYDASQYPMGLFSREYFKLEAAFASKQLKDHQRLKAKELSETESISLALLKFQLQDQIDYHSFERFLNPLLSDSGFHSSFTYMARPLNSYKQVISYLNKLNALPDVVDQYLPLLWEGIEKGVSQPRVIFNGYESTYDTHIVDNFEDSFFISLSKIYRMNLQPSRRIRFLLQPKK